MKIGSTGVWKKVTKRVGAKPERRDCVCTYVIRFERSSRTSTLRSRLLEYQSYRSHTALNLQHFKIMTTQTFNRLECSKTETFSIRPKEASSIDGFYFTLGAGDVISGWDIGFASMNVGECAVLKIEPEYLRKPAMWVNTRKFYLFEL